MRQFITTIVLGLCSVGATAEAAPSVSAFTEGPKIQYPAISPDGRFLAAVAELDGKRVAMVLNVHERTPFNVVMTSRDGANVAISWCEWGNDTRLVCALRGTGSGYSPLAKLVAVDADGTNIKELNAVYAGDKVIDWTINEPQSVLVEAPNGIGELNIYTGRYKDRTTDLLSEVWATDKIRNFYGDGAGGFLLGYRRRVYSGEYFARTGGERDWRRLTLVPNKPSFELDLQPMRAAAAGNTAYAVGVHDDRNALWTIDLTDKRPPQVVFSHPRVDVFGPVMVGNDFVGASYYTDRPLVHYIDGQVAAQMQVIDKTLTGTANRIESWTRDRKTWVINATSDVNGSAYYLYSGDSAKLVMLGRAYPELDASNLGRTRAVEFPAQDGTLIPALLTEPPGEPSAKRPMIVLVHDLDDMPAVGSFDSVVQFLTSRGYAVLRVDFRGSLGYGRTWLKAARYDWSGLPYSDSLDGARWAAAQGFADANRICIMGRRWGGYTALLGAVRNSGVFKCAAAVDATGDLSHVPKWILESGPKHTQTESTAGLDTSTLRKDAPRWNADRINIPVLLVHYTVRGIEDDEMQAMAKALRRAHKPHTEVEIEVANLRLQSGKDRAQLLESLEKFFAAHIGP